MSVSLQNEMNFHKIWKTWRNSKHSKEVTERNLRNFGCEKMENKRFAQNRMGTYRKGGQGQTQRVVMLKEKKNTRFETYQGRNSCPIYTLSTHAGGLRCSSRKCYVHQTFRPGQDPPVVASQVPRYSALK